MIAYGSIIIRPIEKHELEIVQKWYNDDEVMYWGSGARPDIMYTLDYLENVWYEEIFSDSCSRMMIQTKDGLPIGLIGYNDMNMRERKCRLSIFIGEKGFWGNGYGSDAINAFTKYLFNRWNLNRIEVDTWDGNERAVKCYEKCGFKVEGRLRKARFVDGQYRDEIILGIIREDMK